MAFVVVCSLMHSFFIITTLLHFFFFFFFNDTATTEIYTLSLHDALPIWSRDCAWRPDPWRSVSKGRMSSLKRSGGSSTFSDRKSTRLNSSHDQISYAVFCLKKKKKKNNEQPSYNKHAGRDTYTH